MAPGKVFIALSVMLFGQVFGNFDSHDHEYFENGFDDSGMLRDTPGVGGHGFQGSGGLAGGSMMSSGRGIGGRSGHGRGFSGGSGHAHGFMGKMDYPSHPTQPRFDSGISGGILGGDSFRPMRSMGMPRRMPMVTPSIGGGMGGFRRFPKMGGGVSGGILGSGRSMFPRRRISHSIGGLRSRGYGRHFGFGGGMMGRGGLGGMSRRRFKTY